MLCLFIAFGWGKVGLIGIYRRYLSQVHESNSFFFWQCTKSHEKRFRPRYLFYLTITLTSDILYIPSTPPNLRIFIKPITSSKAPPWININSYLQNTITLYLSRSFPTPIITYNTTDLRSDLLSRTFSS